MLMAHQGKGFTFCHGDMRYNARIRELMSFLSEWFSDEPFRNG